MGFDLGGFVGRNVKDVATLNYGDFAKNWMGAYSDLSGAGAAADAAQNAANAQAAFAAQNRADQLNYITGDYGQKLTDLSKASTQELNILGQTYQAAHANLQQQQKLMSNIDPALMEASKQALSILQGGQSAMGAGIMGQRNQQRQQLVNSLRAQYGPGAETSSIGQRVLQNFDLETQSLAPQMLGSLMGVQQQGQQMAHGVQSGIASLQDVGQQYGNIQQRQINAQNQIGNATLGVYGNTAGALSQAAGAPFVGQALRAQQQGAMANTALQLGGTALGAYFGGPMGAAAGGKLAQTFAQKPQPMAASSWETGPPPQDISMMPASNASYGNVG